jgi:hypothetical protein
LSTPEMPEDLLVSARHGRLEALIALRDLLAVKIDECRSDRDLAALTNRFLQVLEQIEALESPVAKAADDKPGSTVVPKTTVDQIRERREARKKGA